MVLRARCNLNLSNCLFALHCNLPDPFEPFAQSDQSQVWAGCHVTLGGHFKLGVHSGGSTIVQMEFSLSH